MNDALKAKVAADFERAKAAYNAVHAWGTAHQTFVELAAAFVIGVIVGKFV